MLVTFRVDILNVEMGRSYWKMNTILLETNERFKSSLKELIDDFVVEIERNGNASKPGNAQNPEKAKTFKNLKTLENVNSVNDEISLTVDTKSSDMGEKWASLKYEIAECSKELSKEIARNERRCRLEIEKNINWIKEKLAVFPNSQRLKEEIRESLEKLKSFDEAEIKKRMHSTHFYNIAHDRHSMLSAKQAQKKSAFNRLMVSLKARNGKKLSKQEEIMKEVHSHLKNELKSKGICEEDLLTLLQTPPAEILSEDDNELLEGKIRNDEVVAAIRSFEKHKTPGKDGIPIEFYKVFEAELSPLLTEVYNNCYDEGELINSMYEGVIKQVFKEKGDKEDLANWRPLTMLNVDYKILAKVLLNRMKLVAGKIVSLDQTCSVKGRDIRDGVFAILNAIEDANTDGIEAVIVSVDHKTAFDMIEWQYLFRVLEHFGFSKRFIKWIRTIYKRGKVVSSVIVNGWVSESFEVTRGIRQGCPLSALLYVIASEIACNSIRANENVKGITVAGKVTKLSNYADDTNFLVDGFASIDEILKMYYKFHRASGATLNEKKTKMLTLNVLSACETPDRYKKFVVPELKVYGFTFDKGGLALNLCFVEVEKSISKLELSIPHHEFSLESRSQFISTYYLSKFWFVCSFASPPPDLLKRCEKAISRFLWFPTKQNKIRKEVIKNCKENGGIGMQDIGVKIKAMRLMLLIRHLKSPEGYCWSPSFAQNLKNLRRWPKSEWPLLSCVPVYKDILKIESESELRIIDAEHISIFGKQFKLNELTTKLCI